MGGRVRAFRPQRSVLMMVVETVTVTLTVELTVGFGGQVCGGQVKVVVVTVVVRGQLPPGRGRSV